MSQAMNKETKDYYENYFMMFATPGWKQLVEDTEKVISDIKERAFNGDANNFYMCKGTLEQANRLVYFETILRNSYEVEEEYGEPDDSV